MSGGQFSYDQYKIGYIANAIEKEIEKSGKPKTREELKDEPWHTEEFYQKWPEELNHHKYSDEVIERFKLAVRYLRIAEVYAHRVDWLLSGDDGEENFIERLNEDLKGLAMGEALKETKPRKVTIKPKL